MFLAVLVVWNVCHVVATSTNESDVAFLAAMSAWPFTTLEISANVWCAAHRDRAIVDRNKELFCCDIQHKLFSTYWYLGGMYISENMETLRRWKCPQFESECRNRTFAFTNFTKTIYQRACNRRKFQEECYQSVGAVALENALASSNNVTDEQWRQAAEKLVDKDLPENPSACVQVASYDVVKPFGQFHESVFVLMPFCGVIWCGSTIHNVKKFGSSYWRCMDGWCRGGFIFSIVLITVISFTITIVNACVVAVFQCNRNLLNSQGVYKLSLAVADLLVGIIVLPSFAYVLYTIAHHQPEINQAFRTNENGSDNLYLPSGHFKGVLYTPYVWFVGFVTTFCLCISVNTLLLAGWDRLSVVREPLKYSPDNAKTLAKNAVLVLWIVAALLASLPFYVPTLKFAVVASVMISSAGQHALYLNLATFLLPFVGMWATTIATCAYTFKHARDRCADDFAMEIRLTKTLLVMVLVFTANLLPVLLSILGALLLSGIAYHRPMDLKPHLAAGYVTFEFIAVMALVCNSAGNFFVYNARNESFRNGTRQIFRKLIIVRMLTHNKTGSGTTSAGAPSTEVSSITP